MITRILGIERIWLMPLTCVLTLSPGHLRGDPMLTASASPAGPTVRTGDVSGTSFFVGNNGDERANGARFIVTASGGLALIANGTFKVLGQTATWNLGDVDPGQFLSDGLSYSAVVPDGQVPSQETIDWCFDADNADPRSGTVMVEVLPKAKQFADPNRQGQNGDPVQTFAGNYVLIEPPDLMIPGPNPLRLQRNYDSRMGDDGVIESSVGDNWQHNYELSLDIDGADATVGYLHGRVITFQNDGAGWNLTDRVDIGFQLVEQAPDFVLADPRSRMRYRFDAAGKLVRIEDQNGNANILSYSAGRPAAASDDFGRAITFAYDAGGRLISASDGTRTVSYGHTGDNLTSFTDAAAKVTNYAYDAANPHSSALMTARTRPEGNAPFTQSYDAQGRVASQTDAAAEVTQFGYSAVPGARLTTMTDPLGQTMVHRYGSDGELARITDQSGQDLRFFTDAQGRRNNIFDRTGENILPRFDASTGLPTRISHAGIGNDQFTYTTRVLDGIDFHDLTRHQHPDSRINEFAYDAKGNLTEYGLRDGMSYTFTYNPSGQPLTITNPTTGVTTLSYDAQGRLETLGDSDPFTGVTSFQYDALNRVRQIDHPDATSRSYQWDALDRPTSLTDERSNATNFEYDDNGRLVRITDAETAAASFEYDGLDRLVRFVNRLGQDTKFAYDRRGQLEQVTDANDNASRFTYDARGRLATVSDPGGNTTRYEYDAEGRVTAVTNPDLETVTLTRDLMGYVSAIADPLHNSYAIGRDAMKNVISITDPMERQTQFQRTVRGQLSNVIHEFPASAEDIGSSYTYDDRGNLTNLRDPNLRDWNFAYTPMGRLTGITDPSSRTTDYDYDDRGRFSVVTFPNAETATFSYDEVGNLTRVLYTDGTDLNFSYDSLDRLKTTDDLEFDYNANGDVINTVSSGQNFGAGYDPGRRLTAVSYPDPGGVGGAMMVTYTYNNQDRLTSINDDLTGTSVEFGYDAIDRITSVSRPNGIDASFEYDAAGRLTRLREGVLIDIAYTYDASGLLISTTDHAVPLDPATLLAEESSAFNYSNASQVSSAGYSYDAVGRRITAPPGHTYSWAGPDRLISQDGLISYEYGGLNQLVRRTEGADEQRFFYNLALGRRAIVAERDEGSGQFERYYVCDPNGNLVYFIEFPGNTVHFPHLDHSGSVLALSDAAGTVTDTYAYDPYGATLGRTGSSDQPFRYHGVFGVRTDGALLHMGARWYDPATAAFLSKEPLWFDPNEPIKANPYQFANRNPTRYGDPLGTDGQVFVPAYSDSGNGFYVGESGFRDRAKAPHLFRLAQALTDPLSDRFNPSYRNIAEILDEIEDMGGRGTPILGIPGGFVVDDINGGAARELAASEARALESVARTLQTGSAQSIAPLIAGANRQTAYGEPASPQAQGNPAETGGDDAAFSAAIGAVYLMSRSSDAWFGDDSERIFGSFPGASDRNQTTEEILLPAPGSRAVLPALPGGRPRMGDALDLQEQLFGQPNQRIPNLLQPRSGRNLPRQ